LTCSIRFDDYDMPVQNLNTLQALRA
jgi:hypothetical protein